MVSTILARVLLVLSFKLFPSALHTALVTSLSGTDQLNSSTSIPSLGGLQLSYQTCPLTLPILHYVLCLVTTINDGPDAIPYFDMEYGTLDAPSAEIGDSVSTLPVQRSQPAPPITQSHHMVIIDPPARYDAMVENKIDLTDFEYRYYFLRFLSPPKVVWDVLSVALVSLLCRGYVVLAKIFWNFHFGHNTLYGPVSVSLNRRQRRQLAASRRRQERTDQAQILQQSRLVIENGIELVIDLQARLKTSLDEVSELKSKLAVQSSLEAELASKDETIRTYKSDKGHMSTVIRQTRLSNEQNTAEAQRARAESSAKGLKLTRLQGSMATLQAEIALLREKSARDDREVDRINVLASHQEAELKSLNAILADMRAAGSTSTSNGSTPATAVEESGPQTTEFSIGVDFDQPESTNIEDNQVAASLSLTMVTSTPNSHVNVPRAPTGPTVFLPIPPLDLSDILSLPLDADFSAIFNTPLSIAGYDGPPSVLEQATSSSGALIIQARDVEHISKEVNSPPTETDVESCTNNTCKQLSSLSTGLSPMLRALTLDEPRECTTYVGSPLLKAVTCSLTPSGNEAVNNEVAFVSSEVTSTPIVRVSKGLPAKAPSTVDVAEVVGMKEPHNVILADVREAGSPSCITGATLRASPTSITSGIISTVVVSAAELQAAVGLDHTELMGIEENQIDNSPLSLATPPPVPVSQELVVWEPAELGFFPPTSANDFSDILALPLDVDFPNIFATPLPATCYDNPISTLEQAASTSDIISPPQDAGFTYVETNPTPTETEPTLHTIISSTIESPILEPQLPQGQFTFTCGPINLRILPTVAAPSSPGPSSLNPDQVADDQTKGLAAASWVANPQGSRPIRAMKRRNDPSTLSSIPAPSPTQLLTDTLAIPPTQLSNQSEGLDNTNVTISIPCQDTSNPTAAGTVATPVTGEDIAVQEATVASLGPSIVDTSQQVSSLDSLWSPMLRAWNSRPQSPPLEEIPSFTLSDHQLPDNEIATSGLAAAEWAANPNGTRPIRKMRRGQRAPSAPVAPTSVIPLPEDSGITHINLATPAIDNLAAPTMEGLEITDVAPQETANTTNPIEDFITDELPAADGPKSIEITCLIQSHNSPSQPCPPSLAAAIYIPHAVDVTEVNPMDFDNAIPGPSAIQAPNSIPSGPPPLATNSSETVLEDTNEVTEDVFRSTAKPLGRKAVGTHNLPAGAGTTNSPESKPPTTTPLKPKARGRSVLSVAPGGKLKVTRV